MAINYILIPQTAIFHLCFSWMIPNLYIKNCWKSPNIHLKNGCFFGFQVAVITLKPSVTDQSSSIINPHMSTLSQQIRDPSIVRKIRHCPSHSVDGSEIPNNHRLDGAKTLQIMGEAANLNWLVGFSSINSFSFC